jgi:predicted dehydrogenase
MSNRRAFLGQVIGGAVAGLASSSRILGANDRIRIGLIGAGDRGTEIFEAAMHCPNVEAVAVADLYTRKLERAQAKYPQLKTYQDFRRLLDDKSIDAVLIATPQHQHALNFVPAIQAGKDVYQEKTMAFTVDHAKRMRKALDGSGRVVQVGIQITTGAGNQQVRELATPERMGTITAIQTFHYRNSRNGGWLRPIPSDCNEQHIDWPMFQGEAAKHPFDPQRYMNWRFFWDYSGGDVTENMVHQLGFWYKALDLKIPEAVTMSGANYLSPKMEVPDTMTVSMSFAEKILFNWNGIFGNDFFSETYDYAFGTKGTLIHNQGDKVFYLPQQQKPTPEMAADLIPYTIRYKEVTGMHMQNFFDCVRDRKQPNCPFEIGFRTAITTRMALTSYHQKRTVRWNAETEEIV